MFTLKRNTVLLFGVLAGVALAILLAILILLTILVYRLGTTGDVVEVTRIVDVTDTAPPAAPLSLPTELSIFINAPGAEEFAVLEAVVAGVEWHLWAQDRFGQDPRILLWKYSGGEPAFVREISPLDFDRNQAINMLHEAGLSHSPELVVLVPENDPALEDMGVFIVNTSRSLFMEAGMDLSVSMLSTETGSQLPTITLGRDEPTQPFTP